MNLSIARLFVSLASHNAEAKRRRLAALFCAAALACRPFSSPPAPSGNVEPLVVGRLVAPDSGLVDSTDLRFVLPVEIHGRVFRMMVDHGSNGTLLTDSTIERLGLPHWYATATRVDTVVRRGGVTPRRDS